MKILDVRDLLQGERGRDGNLEADDGDFTRPGQMLAGLPRLDREHYIEAMNIVTVWYDGSCPLCSREIAAMKRLDRGGAVSFVDVGGDESIGCPIDRLALLERFHAREGSGPVVSGAAAFAAMWRAIPLLRPLGLAARSPFVLGKLERLYIYFLRLRPRSPALAEARALSEPADAGLTP